MARPLIETPSGTLNEVTCFWSPVPPAGRFQVPRLPLNTVIPPRMILVVPSDRLPPLEALAGRVTVMWLPLGGAGNGIPLSLIASVLVYWVGFEPATVARQPSVVTSETAKSSCLLQSAWATADGPRVPATSTSARTSQRPHFMRDDPPSAIRSTVLPPRWPRRAPPPRCSGAT